MKKLILALLFLFAVSSDSLAQNVLLNGSFEDGMDHWSHWSHEDGEVSVITSGDAPDGNNYLRMWCSGSIGSLGCWVIEPSSDNYKQLENDWNFRLTFTYRMVTEYTWPFIEQGKEYHTGENTYMYYRGIAVLYGDTWAPDTTTDVWKTVVLEFDTDTYGQGNLYSWLDIGINGSGGINNYVDIDNIILEKLSFFGNTPTPTNTPSPTFTPTCTPIKEDLSDVGNFIDGVRFEGAHEGHWLGSFVSGAGDFNGDGTADVIMGAPYGGASTDMKGESYLVFGGQEDLSTDGVFSVADVNGTNGLRFVGQVGDQMGWSVADAGDVNADGFADIILGAPEVSPGGKPGAGAAYLVYGSDNMLGSGGSIDITTLGSGAVQLEGVSVDDGLGNTVACAGDFNGDGYDDVLVASCGSPDGKTNAGMTYLLYGSVNGITDNLAELDGTEGVRFDGINLYDVSGACVSGCGDFNGDGLDDFLIGAPGADPSGVGMAGEAYLILGSDSGIGTDGSFDLSTLDGTNGVSLQGSSESGSAGISVRGAGDINEDGFADLIIGAYKTTTPPDRYIAGRAYLVFGSSALPGTSGVFDLGALDGNNGVIINGWDYWGYAGISVSSAGDWDGDGVFDLIIGAPRVNAFGKSDNGVAYFLSGWALYSVPGGAFSLYEIDGYNGVRYDGKDRDDNAGQSVAGCGDFTGDGNDDILVSAPGSTCAGYSNAGSVYLIAGKGDRREKSYKAFSRSGNAPPTFVGSNPNGSNGKPASLCKIDFKDGTGPGHSGASMETVKLSRGNLGLGDKQALLVWDVSTDRTGWSQAALTFYYPESLARAYTESDFFLIHRETELDPWQRVADQMVEIGKNTVSANVTAFSEFALAIPISSVDNWEDNYE